MGDPVAQQTVLQGLDHRPLTDDLVKGLGTCFSGKDQIGHVGSSGGWQDYCIEIAVKSDKPEQRQGRIF